MSKFTIVDANGEHFGYGRTGDLGAVLADAERLNRDPRFMAEVASGDLEFYASPFRPVRVANERGRVTELGDRVAAPAADVDAWHARLRSIAAAANRPARPVYGQAGRWS